MRLCEAVNAFDDNAFARLSEKARGWFNAASEVINKGTLDAIPALEGLPALQSAEPSSAPQPEEEESPVNASAPQPATTSKSKPKKNKGLVRKKEGAPAAKKAPSAGRPGAFSSSQKITLLVTENPKRSGSRAYKLYSKYATCGTVGGYLQAGGKRSDLRWDVGKKFISIK